MNGQSVQAAGRAFSVSGELSVQGEGTITGGGFAAKGSNGGVFNVSETGTLNLYGGTYKAGRYGDHAEYGSNGGVLYVAGEANLYNGTLVGGKVSNIGDAAFVAPAGTMKLYGGKVTGEKFALFAQGVWSCPVMQRWICFTCVIEAPARFMASSLL